jgi:succinoglycan biosynthesis protein ExoA
VIPPSYVRRTIDTLRRTGAANVGGRQVPVAADGFGRAVAVAMASPLGSGGAAYRTGVEEGVADTVYLGAFRREALEEVGGFDPRFTRNQDAELNLRLRRAGYLVWYDPELAVAYQPRATVRALARQYLEYGRWRRLTVRVHPGSLAPRQLAPPVALLTLLGGATVAAAARDVRPVALTAGGYLGVLVAGATAASPRLRLVPATTAALAVMHLAWGAGFLVGPPRGSAGGDDERV